LPYHRVVAPTDDAYRAASPPVLPAR
jgi:hypothetical protein